MIVTERLGNAVSSDRAVQNKKFSSLLFLKIKLEKEKEEQARLRQAEEQELEKQRQLEREKRDENERLARTRVPLVTPTPPPAEHDGGPEKVPTLNNGMSRLETPETRRCVLASMIKALSPLTLS